jgi:phosphoribosylformylglycinamidine cyclo-ligase
MSESYKKSGVDIAAGDAASALAARAARSTFAGRNGKMGQPVDLPGGFAGVLDFGDFYLVQCCDTVGTKIDLCRMTGDYSELGLDLLAMVADDAACLGAEVVSITNTFETDSIDSEKIGIMMDSLASACREQNIVIAGGEIAEVGSKIQGTSWGADAVGIVQKDRVLTGEKIQPGDSIISLQETGFRCNGYSLVRRIIHEHFQNDIELIKKCQSGSTVYHAAVLDVCGRYGEEQKATLHGIAHITGGGIPGNLWRILKKKGLGANLPHLFSPSEEMLLLADRAKIPASELYEVWNGGNGMLLVCPVSETEQIIGILQKRGVAAQCAGEVTDSEKIVLSGWNGETIVYKQ